MKAKTIVSDSMGPIADYKRSAGLGVVCVLESSPSTRLKKLLNAEKVVAIFDKTVDAVSVRSKDVLTLVNFLHFVTWRYRVHGSQPGYPQVTTRFNKP